MESAEYFLANISVVANRALALAITWIIETDTTAVLIGHYASCEVKSFQHEDAIEEALRNWDARSQEDDAVGVKIIIEGDHFYEESQTFFQFDEQLSVEEIAYYFHAQKRRAIFLLDNMEAFGELEKDLLNERNHYLLSGHYWIIYTHDAAARRLYDVEQMFRRLFSGYVLNVYILVVQENETIAFTYYPFAEQQCENFEPVKSFILQRPPQLDRYEVNATDLPLFQNKLVNMWQCTVKVVTWTYEPFMIVESGRLRGIEGLLLNLLAEKMNFTAYVIEPPSRDRGYYFPNGTVTGAIKMIADGDANVTILCITIDKLRSQVSWPSYPYMYIPLIVGIPPGRPLSPFVRLIRPFKIIIWSCLTASFVLGIVAILRLQSRANRKVRAFLFGRRNRTPLTNFFSVWCGVPAYGELPYGTFARYLFSLWLAYTIIFRTAYMGQLYHIMQDGRPSTLIATLREVVALNYTFYTFPTLSKAIKDTAGSSAHIEYIEASRVNITTLLQHINDNNSHYVITMLQHGLRAYNQRQRDRKRLVKILPQKLITSPITLYMRKHSYLKDQFNELLLLIMSSGFIGYFEKLYLDNMQGSFGKIDTEPVALSVRQISALFALHLTLLAMCFLIFSIEIYSQRSKRLRKAIKFFNH